MALIDSFPGASGTVDSTELRKNLAGLIVRDTSGIPRAGVFPRHANALVTSRADMKLDVAAFEGVSVRGGGPLFMANDGVVQSPTLPIPVANSHICVLYFKQNESVAPYADADNLPIFGVVTGAASGTPAKPSITGIAGATELATITVPSTATATNSGGVVITQSFQYTAVSGGTVLFRTATEQNLFAAADGTSALLVDSGMSQIRAGGAWVSKDLVNLQLDTANSTVRTITQMGIGRITGNGATVIGETVTFPVPFASVPVVTANFLGLRPTGAFNSSGLTQLPGATAQAQAPAPSSAVVDLYWPSTFGSGNEYYYSWIAIGVPA